LWIDDDLNSCLRLDGVVTLIDSSNFESYLIDKLLEYDIKMQIAYADRILLNKTDLIRIEKVKRFFCANLANTVLVE